MTMPLNDFGDGQQTISSRSARIFIQQNGQNKLFANVTDFKSTVKKTKEKVNALGTFSTKHKLVGFEITGSLSGYVVDSSLVGSEISALKNGADNRFQIIVEAYGNDSQGTQRYLLSSVSLDDVPLADLKADDSLMKFESDFTAEDIDLLDSFK
jgi:hypothetical protein